uniref:Ig-like domain-containing protein n=1 Tax=Cyprinus carpio carpio TaxID=630221 RepID=A0A9J7ZAP7_CYPCA
MSCQYSLVFVFLFGFTTALTVAEICKTDLLEGTSCTIKLPTKNTDKSNEITWAHLSSDAVIHRKNGRIKKPIPGLTMEEDGSLTFGSVSLKNTGKYKYTVYNAEGTQIDAGEKEIKVYAKVPKPTLTIKCKDGNATLTCDFRERPDLIVSWYEEGKIIQKEKNPKLFLKSDKIQEKKTYSCSVGNPASTEQSNSIMSCSDTGPGGDSGPRKLFGFDFWIMVSILAGGGSLLLLLICVLVICACRSCKTQRQHEQDEDELRLRIFQDEGQNGTARSKHTARGQPAPPIPQEEPSPQIPTQTQTQPKAQTRGRPPPPPEDDDENPPPLPRPRNKQHRKRHEEPYRPME